MHMDDDDEWWCFLHIGTWFLNSFVEQQIRRGRTLLGIQLVLKGSSSNDGNVLVVTLQPQVSVYVTVVSRRRRR